MIKDSNLILDPDDDIPCTTPIDELIGGYAEAISGERVRAVLDPNDKYAPVLILESNYGIGMIRVTTGNEYAYKIKIIPKDIIEKEIRSRILKLKEKSEEYEKFIEEFDEFY